MRELGRDQQSGDVRQACCYRLARSNNDLNHSRSRFWKSSHKIELVSQDLNEVQLACRAHSRYVVGLKSYFFLSCLHFNTHNPANADACIMSFLTELFLYDNFADISTKAGLAGVCP